MGNLENQKNLENNESKTDIELSMSGLIDNIGKKYGLKNDTIKELITFETSKFLEELQNNDIIEEKERSIVENFEEEKLNNFINEIESAKKEIEKISIEDRNKLMSEVKENAEYVVEKTDNYIEKFLPKKLLELAKNPERFSDHILGLSLGTVNSIINSGKVIGVVGYGILKSPYDLFLLITGKGKYNGWKNV